MDYLTFGLLAGSVIVITSFLLRDAAPHLSALSPSPRLGRLSRRGAPLAWGRWCADAGLVVSAAGTLVLLATVGALVADVADGVGTIVVALALTAALVGAALGLARLTTRYRDDVAAEIAGAPASRPDVPNRRRVDAQQPTAAQPVVRAATPVPQVPQPSGPMSTPGQVPAADVAAEFWDDDLPTWSGSSAEMAPVAGPIATRSSARSSPATLDDASSALTALHHPDHPNDHLDVDHDRPAARVPKKGPTLRPVRSVEGDRGTAPVPVAVDPIGGEPAATVIGGSFSSPLLADIGLPSPDEAADGFRSRLLLDLDRPVADESGHDGETGSDILLDESPAPAFPSTRGRDELS